MPNERLASFSVSGLTQYLGRLGPDFRILVLEQLKQDRPHSHPCSFRRANLSPLGLFPRLRGGGPIGFQFVWQRQEETPCLFPSDQFN